MKKTIALFAAILLLSCSKDDDGIKKVTPQNLAGQYNFKSIVRANGSIVPYVGLCPSKTDYVEIFAHRKIVTYNNNLDCNTTSDFGCTDFSIDENNVIIICGSLFDDAKVTSLNSSGFKIEYDEPRALTYMIDNITDAKSIIFERR